MTSRNPTNEFYSALNVAYQHFNALLFDNDLPEVMFTTQRRRQTMGYFSKDRWTSPSGDTCHEIAINPDYVSRSALLELLQTLVHEMAHCWQHCHGTVSRKSYHNKEWAEKMESIGLMPSSTGEPGGRKTGQSMNDYPIKNGQFLQACESLIQKKTFLIPWVDRYAKGEQSKPVSDDLGLDEEITAQLTTQLTEIFKPEQFEPINADESVAAEKPEPKGKTKSTYVCNGCGLKTWGKPELDLNCNRCNLQLEERRE